MKITEALKILQAATSRPADLTYQVLLICGFTPLHLGTFLAAHLQQRLADRKVSVSTGLYGNVAGTLESLKEAHVQAVALALEWQDLDPRLGFRSAGAWGPSALADILNVARTMLDRMAVAIENTPAGLLAFQGRRIAWMLTAEKLLVELLEIAAKTRWATGP